MPRITWDRVISAGVFLIVAGIGVWLVHIELEASPIQSRLFSKLADEMTYAMDTGPAPVPRYPIDGPYDLRLGYTQMARTVPALQKHNYLIQSQARMSPALIDFVDFGGFPIFPEKSQAGLSLLDRNGQQFYFALHPEQVFVDFESIPPLIVDTLLYIENRELLSGSNLTSNPAVEWDRFALASANLVVDKVASTGRRFGGSTLATQIEKFRHSPEGRTGSAVEKLQQIASASLRAYSDGRDTGEARRRLVVDYLNSTPLAARPGFGEVIGLGDGLWAWYGTDLAAAVRLLSAPARSPAEQRELAVVYKQVLSLLLAQRRPSHYLLAGRDDLLALTDSHLRVLADAGVISAELCDLALSSELVFRKEPPAPAEFSFIDRKAINAIRAHLLSLLQVDNFYDLDRLDVRAEASLDMPAQKAVIEMLRRMGDPNEVDKLGLVGHRLLDADSAPNVRYSVTLYERGNFGNFLRVQADNLERPLDLNEGGKLDLGSTAKLRTLVTYLEIVAELHRRYSRLKPAELVEVGEDAADGLTRWSAEYLARAEDRSLQSMLDAAMLRKYSASPGESFFTGRGMHTFANFDRTHDRRIMTVAEAMRYSVNLVFIRMMRDIVYFHLADGPEPARDILGSPDHPARAEYLERFADMEGSIFLNRFFARYRGRTPDEALSILASRSRPVPHRLAVVFRSARPQASLAEFGQFMRTRLPDTGLSDAELARLYATYGADRFSLQDRGYLARVHPLELWLAAYLQKNPEASRAQILAASTDERQEVYEWLFKKKRQGAANSRIRIILEQEAFRKIHESWERLGYPFPDLVPSYATAIGTSADRPAALAELMGILLNDGLRLPLVRIEQFHLAEGTPYETHMSYGVNRVERVLPKELTRTVRRALADVVENGTARRVGGAYHNEDGTKIAIGGKTGTGDELADSLPAHGDREVSRSAAFVFFLGDRHFGVVTAHVPGQFVRRFSFTSALPVQVLAALAPALEPLVQQRRPLPPGQVIAASQGTVR
jgi:membrane peptidoglycan carboxypeptidase